MTNVLDERYELIKKIGSGGMADVYVAKDVVLDRLVAIKILHSNFEEDDDFIIRFRHEAQAAGKLTHPNIVAIYDVGCDQNVHYIVMEYVKGQTLKNYIQEHDQIPIDMAVRITVDIGHALETAHANGIIHCDIKPHNILLADDGKVKVTDFGIARAISSSTVIDKDSILGSVHYLSPEQASGDKITAKTDIYSLGIILYEMLTHRLPFEGETAVSIALKHMQEDVPRPTKYNPSISPTLEECILCALQKDPENRYSAVSDFISELDLAQGFTTSIYKPTQPEYNGISKTFLSKKKQLKVEAEREESRYVTVLSSLPQKYIWLGMITIFLICFAWVFFSFGNFWSTETVSVPKVVGKPMEVAEQILIKENLRVSIDEISSEEIPAGQVIAQTPTAGTNVKLKRMIHLTVSKGGGNILIPDLKGLTLEQAKKRLEKLGLSIGVITNGSEEGQPEDTIISQNPGVAAKANKGTQVNIVVNVKKVIEIPNTIGMTLKEAKDILASHHVALGRLTFKDGTSVEDSKAIVTDQKKSGEGMVDLTLSKGQVEKKSGTVNISIPKGSQPKKVEIFVTDKDGRQTVFSKEVKPGDAVKQEVSGKGDVHIQVLIDGDVVEDRAL